MCGKSAGHGDRRGYPAHEGVLRWPTRAGVCRRAATDGGRANRTMTSALRSLVETSNLGASEVASRTRSIRQAVLRESSYLDGADFTAIHPSDLQRLFDAYDRWFFDGHVGGALGATPLRFRLSSRLTSAGGKVARYASRGQSSRSSYEISVSTTLLFQCFTDDDHRAIRVAGVACADRLEALQRVLEHELIHLVEMLLWTRSRCAGRRFQSIAARVFGHRDHTHELITPGERALATFGIRSGSRVRFRYAGADYTGVVNRITRRATVLVPDPRGVPYSDGHRYATFYVPVEMLEALGVPGAAEARRVRDV